MVRFFIQWQDFEGGFSSVSAICINQVRNQNFFGNIFVELGYFDKHLLKRKKKRPFREKFFSPKKFFLLYIFKATFWM